MLWKAVSGGASCVEVAGEVAGTVGASAGGVVDDDTLLQRGAAEECGAAAFGSQGIGTR